MHILILGLILALGAFTLASRDLLHSVIALSAISMLSALLFTILRAPDVAITEAAVGAGVSTVIFVWAIRHTQRRDEEES
ncbi:MAG: hydrogenase subunit MbhD domain-containing protein [Sphaerochaeta sp.]|nr:hydrogenase subunit MbhD domain-containing protein [Sphaerochaeta sp.]HAP56640.1 hydrogenase [Sphaerochaeta sp.]HBO35584.1 hydrogenase [Sphaerochaeta sp.]